MKKRLFGTLFLFSGFMMSVAFADEVLLSKAEDLNFVTENGMEMVYAKDGKPFSGAVMLPDEEDREITYFYRNGKKHGIAMAHYENNNVELEITYEKGVKNGEEILFYANGNPHYKKTYKNNVLDGEEILFYENGNPEKRSIYSNGKLDGEVRYFDRDKNPTRIETYKNGEKNGMERIIVNNILREENQYLNGKLDGICKKFSEKYLTDEISYKNGVKEGLHKTYLEDGSVIETPYVNDMKEGIGVAYYPDQKVSERKTYHNDYKNGLSQKFYQNGQIYLSENYKNDKLEGIFRTFNDKGELLAAGYYVDGVALGNVVIAQEKDVYNLYNAYKNKQLFRFSNKKQLWYKLLWLGLTTEKADILQELEKEMKMYASSLDDMKAYERFSSAQFAPETKKYYFGLTPLSYAVNIPAATEVLQKFISQIALPNERGTTVLQEAVRMNNAELVKYVLLQQADITQEDKNGDTILLYALKNNAQKSVIEALIKAGADVNKTDKQGNTPLVLALSSPDTAKLLIDSGADVNATDAQGNAPLMLAIDNTDLASYLIKNGADVNITDKQGNTPLILTINKQNTELVKLLAQYHADMHVLTPNGQTLLFYAYENKAPESMIEQLFLSGADINKKDAEENSLLLKALENQDKKMVMYLLKSGADINQVNAQKENAVSYVLSHDVDDEILAAVFNADIDVKNRLPKFDKPLWKLLMEQKRFDLLKIVWNKMPDITFERDINDEVPLYSAMETENIPLQQLALSYVKKADPKLVWMLLKQKDFDLFKVAADKNDNADLQDENEDSLLLYVIKNHYDNAFVEYLLERKADLGFADKAGNNALDLAIADNNAELAELLIKAGADVNKKHDGKTYLMSIKPEQTEIMRLLLDNGADMNGKDANDSNLLLLAAESLNTALVDIILEQETDVLANDDNGNTALHYAVNGISPQASEVNKNSVEKMKEIIDKLTEKGVDINKQNGNGETLLILLAKKNPLYYNAMIDYLREKGVNEEVKDQYSKRAEDYIGTK